MRTSSPLDPAALRPTMRQATRSGDAARARSGGFGWGGVVVLFMRLLAAIWIVQALVQWSELILPSRALFDHVTVQWGAAVIFFAVLDPVAAVGLWLATPWGGVIWLFAALAQIFAAVAIPGFFSPVWIGADGLFIAIYFLLTWRAACSTRPKRS